MNLLRWILMSGISADLDKNEIKRIRLSNILAMVCIFYLVLRAIFNMGLQKYTYSFLLLGAAMFFGLMIFFNRLGLYRLSRHAFLIIGRKIPAVVPSADADGT